VQIDETIATLDNPFAGTKEAISLGVPQMRLAPELAAVVAEKKAKAGVPALPKKPVAKPVLKKPAAKKVAKKSVAKKPVVKKTVTKKPAAKKTTAKKPVAKPVAKKVAAKKVTTKKVTPKKKAPPKPRASSKAVIAAKATGNTAKSPPKESLK